MKMRLRFLGLIGALAFLNSAALCEKSSAKEEVSIEDIVGYWRQNAIPDRNVYHFKSDGSYVFAYCPESGSPIYSLSGKYTFNKALETLTLTNAANSKQKMIATWNGRYLIAPYYAKFLQQMSSEMANTPNRRYVRAEEESLCS